jgi:hypothetical protein
MFTKKDAKRNRINKRVEAIQIIIAAHGTHSIHLRNYLSKCMESDIRRERKAIKELTGIINGTPCAYQTQKKG